MRKPSSRQTLSLPPANSPVLEKLCAAHGGCWRPCERLQQPFSQEVEVFDREAQKDREGLLLISALKEPLEKSADDGVADIL